MNRWNRIGWFSVAAGLGLSLAALFLGASRTQAVDRSKSPIVKQAEGKLIVHEWGTFTSFSGSNGVQLDFRPLINEDLPNFVLDRQSQSGIPIFSKGRIRASIRMETPVTYFYTDVERTIRAKVEFSSGLLTEFYPPVVGMAPEYQPGVDGTRPFGKSMLDWGEIDLIPVASLTPNIKDAQTKAWLRNLIEQRVVPVEGASNHYYHARETDSAFVHVRQPASTSQFLIRPYGDHLEKFLFYRGVGRFDQPLQATIANDGRIRISNSGQQEIRSLFRVTVANKLIRYSELASVAAGASAEFPLEMQPIELADLQTRVAEALVREELYPREATAMVKTWADSWFTEEGTRIFYMVPREITDNVLPLTVSPPPDETVRVLVGRVEVMLPSVEKQLLTLVAANAIRRQERQELEMEHGPQDPLPIPAEVLKLGRLAEPALVRVRELAKDAATSSEAMVLLRETRQALETAIRKGSDQSAATD
ncbi:MAG: hypothetical protein JSS49_16995 [Planctomycetes bacterium]|nr:hypothetical protein [Planctomycetota bacterium]